MSSEPPRASLLRALFKMEPPAAAAEVLGGAAEILRGERGPPRAAPCSRGPLPCPPAVLGPPHPRPGVRC